MANLITQWLDPNNFAILRDKFNAVVNVLSGGTSGQIYNKFGSGDGEGQWSNFLDMFPTGWPAETYVTDLSVSPYNSKWVAEDGKTLGNSSSTADYQGDQYKPLFVFMWDNFADTEAPVTGGRGLDADSDWTANKKIAVLDSRGYFGTGFDERTSDPSNGVWDIDYATMGKKKGALESTTGSATLTQENMPSGVMLGNVGGGTIGGYDVQPSPGAGSFTNAKIVAGADSGTTQEGNDPITIDVSDTRPPLIVRRRIIKL
jgi:hypothetical protein